MEREHWAYVWGSAKDGCVDCSGAFVWAYKQDGMSIDHGSNSMARRAVTGPLLPASCAKAGWAVFKVRPWSADQATNRWYGQGVGDVYHVGLMGRNGTVLNAKSTASGFVASPLKGWDYCAPLKDVDYENEVNSMGVLYRAVIATEKDPLRVREWAKTGTIIGHIAKGKTVDVLEVDSGWANVRYNELIGWVDERFIEQTDEEVQEESTEEVEAPSEAPTTTLICTDGTSICLMGQWRVAND